MKYQFRQLMEKDFSNVRETQMHPTLIWFLTQSIILSFYLTNIFTV